MYKSEGIQWHDNYLIPTGNCYRTKDGKWIIMLGTEMKRHLSRVIKALGIGSLEFKLKLAKCMIFDIALGDKKVSKMKRAKNLMLLLNTRFQIAIGEMTYDEMKAAFDKHDVWWCDIRSI